jgi:flagellar basal-body rod protein FlgF
MDKGIYVAMTGAMLRMNDLDNIAANVANINTSGYKRTGFSSRLYPLMEGMSKPMNALYNDARSMTTMDKFTVDQSPGTLNNTGNPLDVSLSGEGFFAVEAKGQPAYTRNGSFSIDRDSFLVTAGGYKVIGSDNKPIRITRETNSKPEIGMDGTINLDGNAVGTLKLVKLTDVKSLSDSLYTGKVAGNSTADVIQGSVERSNVNPVRELAAMISAQREFQTLQQLIKTFDQLAQRTINDIAKI